MTRKQPFKKNQIVRAARHQGDYAPHLAEACADVGASRFRIDRCYPGNSDSGWVVDVVLLDKPRPSVFAGGGGWALRPTSAFEVVLLGYCSDWFFSEPKKAK